MSRPVDDSDFHEEKRQHEQAILDMQDYRKDLGVPNLHSSRRQVDIDYERSLKR